MPGQIQWTDEIGSSRCEIPDATLPTMKLMGRVGLGVGVLISSIPFLFSGVFYLMAPEPPEPVVLLLPIGFFGSVIFPVAVFVFYKSSLVVFGRKQIVLDCKQLRAITKVGPLWSTRKCRLADLGGLRIEDPSGERFQMLGDRSSLVAVQKNGREHYLLRMHPNEVVGQLVEELPEKIEQITGRADAVNTDGIPANAITAELTSVDPLRIQSRSNKPIGSNLSVQVDGQDQVVQIPSLGIRKSTSSHDRLFLIGVLFVQLMLSAGLVPALIAGKVEGQPAAGWVIFGVFTIITICVVLFQYNAASRCGSVRITQNSLMFREQNVFGEHATEWTRRTIESVEVAVEEYSSRESTHWNYFVRVKPSSGTQREWFGYREKSELEWIVTLIQDQLDFEVRQT